MVYHFDQNNDGKVVFDEFLAYSGEKIEDFDEKELQVSLIESNSNYSVQ
jgi:Ca2+-binding EF-hand superfamily protein